MNMELRSHATKTLIDWLKDAGVYEDGMNELEMLQMEKAMELSVMETLEQQENELEFMNLQSMHSSTLIMAPQLVNSYILDDQGSPPTAPIYLDVQAIVHHAMDWSPSKEEGLIHTRKRFSVDTNPQLGEPNAKRSMRLLSEREEAMEDQQHGEQPYDPDATPVSPNHYGAGDSGFTWEEVSLSSVSDASFMPSIGEIPSGHVVSTSSVVISDYDSSDN